MENPTEIRVELEKLLAEPTFAGAVDAAQKDEILGTLERSIIFTAASELLDHLTPEGRTLFVKESFENCGKLFVFLRANTAPEVFATAIKQAVDRILGEFLAVPQA